MGGAPSRCNVARCCGKREALCARTNRHGNHVLFKPLIITDTGVAAGGNDVDKIFVGEDFQADIRIGCQKRRNDVRQNQPGGTDGNVELQRAGHLVPVATYLVERRADFGKGGIHPAKQFRAGFGWQNAAGRAVQQAHPEFVFKTLDRIAQRRRTHTTRTGSLAETTGAGDQQECADIVEIRHDCIPLRHLYCPE